MCRPTLGTSGPPGDQPRGRATGQVLQRMTSIGAQGGIGERDHAARVGPGGGTLRPASIGYTLPLTTSTSAGATPSGKPAATASPPHARLVYGRAQQRQDSRAVPATPTPP